MKVNHFKDPFFVGLVIINAIVVSVLMCITLAAWGIPVPESVANTTLCTNFGAVPPSGTCNFGLWILAPFLLMAVPMAAIDFFTMRQYWLQYGRSPRDDFRVTMIDPATGAQEDVTHTVQF